MAGYKEPRWRQVWSSRLGRSPAGGNGNPAQYSYSKTLHKRSLAGSSPKCCKTSNTTEVTEYACALHLSWYTRKAETRGWINTEVISKPSVFLLPSIHSCPFSVCMSISIYILIHAETTAFLKSNCYRWRKTWEIDFLKGIPIGK